MTERKVAIVTGSATGVGAATALALAGRGYNVLINYTKSELDAKASMAACEAAGVDALLMRGDVADDADCKAIVHAVVERWGRVDALVNNAGITSFAGPGNWDAVDAQSFQRIVGVNSLGTFQMIRACTPHLKAVNGSIVNVSSIAGALGIGSSVAYIASKGAVNSMTLYFARALAPQVRVNAVCPGLIATRWFVDGIGQDGYGFIFFGPDGHQKVPQTGRVVIQNNVEVGAGTTIDRGSLRDTVIGEGTKIDNQVQIGHNVTIGRHCLLAAQIGLAGSLTIGDNVALGAKVGINNHLKIGDGAQVTAMSAVKDDIPANGRWGGYFAKPTKQWFREIVAVERLVRDADPKGEGKE